MNYIYGGNNTRLITFEYCITYHNKVSSVSCFRKDTGEHLGDFIDVKTMKAYVERLYKLSRIKFERIYEEGGQNGKI